MKLPTALLLIVATSVATANEQEKNTRLHENLHQMRVMVEQSETQARNAARGNVIGLFSGGAESEGAPSISQMRREVQNSISHMQSSMPCLGAEVEVNDGQAVLICGDNTGYIENTNSEYEDNDLTNIILPGIAPEPARTTAPAATQAPLSAGPED